MAAQSTPTDFVMIDTEHSATNVRALEDLIRTAEAAGVILYVHVPDLHSEVDIRRATANRATPRLVPATIPARHRMVAYDYNNARDDSFMRDDSFIDDY
jgi:2-keto-3-deoxy-L-rhamnonate aldolase RhmA